MKSEINENLVFVENNMPGGNGELVGFDEINSTIVIRPEKKEGSPYRAWFYVRIDNLIPERTYKIKIVENFFAGVYRYSYNPDGPWMHFSDYEEENKNDFSFVLEPTADTLYIAMMPPYLQAHLDKLISETTDADNLFVRDLWTSEEGRSGKLFEIGNPNARFNVWISARMHAFESVSSWVADAFVRWALSDDPDAKWLSANARLNIVPLTDVDSVQNGGTGKHRQPICFARDASENPHWNANKAILEEIEGQGPPDLFIDLHCPGGNVEDTYFYAPETTYTTQAYENDLVEFFDLLSTTFPPAMRYEKRVYRCPFKPDNQGQNMAGTIYFHLHQRYFGKSGLRLAIGSETPWSSPDYTADIIAKCGAAYGKAISQFLQKG